MKQTKTSHKSGFTLVELAIVLVIIGLIIGGVLVGQDLIKAAEIRSTLGQIETYNTTVNAFRDKYRYIPGDINSAQAAQFGFTTRTGAVAHGDGNTLLESCTAGTVLLGCETALFWNDLNSAALVDGNFTTSTDALVTATTSNVVLHLPEAKLGRGNFITVYANTGRNFYQITGVTDVTAGVYTLTRALTPQEAFNMDDKIDDGKPGTGGVRGLSSLTALNALIDMSAAAVPGISDGAVGACGDVAAAGDPYNTLTEEKANTPSCQIRFRFN